ncbi:hypothetical protein ACI2LJ_36015 [Streptomyces sp. NPDC088090]|uniref:hypothetical protein n=1 Tax=Streptomyces sp. NPDC088090 TaxID=3365822 RepID=UPI00384FACF1
MTTVHLDEITPEAMAVIEARRRAPPIAGPARSRRSGDLSVPCALIQGVPARIDPDAAAAFMRENGFDPEIPYPGSGVKWPCICRTCGKLVEPRYATVKRGIGCRVCAGQAVDPAEAADLMRRRGLEPDGPFPGSVKPWKYTCVARGHTDTTTYHSVKSQGAGCRKCGQERNAAAQRLDRAEADAVMRAAGFEPTAPYVSSRAPRACICQTCKEAVHRSHDNIKQGFGCPVCARHATSERQRGVPRPGVNDWRRIMPEAAERVMRAARLEPQEPFTDSAAPWRCLCLDCGRKSKPSHHSVSSKNSRCRYCARNMPTEALVYVMEHPHMNAVKVGVCGLRPGDPRRRTRILVRRGRWRLVWQLQRDVETAYRIEAEVLRHLRDEQGLAPFLTPELMPYGGYTETFDADLITVTVLRRLVERAAVHKKSPAGR